MAFPVNILNNRPIAIQLKNGVDANVATGFSAVRARLHFEHIAAFVSDTNSRPNPVGEPRLVLTALVANDPAASIPAGYCIDDIFIRNTTANAVTGGIKIEHLRQAAHRSWQQLRLAQMPLSGCCH